MHVAIIGNGIAGVTAARRLREKQPDWRITLISGESTHHWSRPALMYLFMGHMSYRDTKPHEDHEWAKWRIDLVRDWVTGIDVGTKTLALHRGRPIRWDKLLIATGSKTNRFGWPGQDLDGVQGLYGLQDLKQLHETCVRTRRAVLVGGGLIGVELAEMLHTRHIPVTFLVRESSFWNRVLPDEESGLVNDVIREAGIDLQLGSELAEIVDDGQGRVGGVVTRDGQRIDCQLVGLTPGVHPNLDVVAGSGVETGRGVLVDRSLRTSATDVYAAGDCAEIVTDGDGPNLLQQVWYTGELQGELVAGVMAGEDRAYEPRIWWNSAKFFDLEYQVYGDVNRNIPGEQSLLWIDRELRRSVRIVHVDRRVIGFNLMGVRYRHEVCERWLRERRSVDDVLDGLVEANFDPEFYRRHEDDVVRTMREQLR